MRALKDDAVFFDVVPLSTFRSLLIIFSNYFGLLADFLTFSFLVVLILSSLGGFALD